MIDQGQGHRPRGLDEVLDEAWIAQAEDIELEANRNGSTELWIGAPLPSIELPSSSTPGSTLNLATAADISFLILCVYPDLEKVRAKRWNDYAEELAREGYRVIALSSDTPSRQEEWASSMKLAYPVVSDSRMQLERLLGLPTRESGEGARVYENMTLVTHTAIAKVFYPMQYPKNDAARVTSWVRKVHAGQESSQGEL